MTIYRRFIEQNEHEGATWDWWLRTDGNELAMAHLSTYLQAAREVDRFYPYELTEDLLSEADVDVLVKHAQADYYPLSNKVDGVLTVPKVIDETLDDRLYKGGIKDFFAVVEPTPAVYLEAGPVTFGDDGFTVTT